MGQARSIEPPVDDLTLLLGEAAGAGPPTAEPSSIEYMLPWHGQLIVSVDVVDGAALVGADGGETLEAHPRSAG